MKLKVINTVLALVALATLNAQPSTAHAQGSLTPPAGAPAPVMKSLDQIEPRTPLVAGQPGVVVNADGSMVINQPGSYYLTSNLTITNSATGINVGLNSVTLDLNGFEIKGAAGTGFVYGIEVGGGTSQSVTIRNGHITGGGKSTGFYSAILLGGANGTLLVENIQMSSLRNGLIASPYDAACTVVNCSVRNVGGTGIQADIVRSCTVQSAGGNGISANLVCDCIAYSSAGIGISASTAVNSQGTSITGSSGMLVSGTASFCRGERSGGVAISAGIAIGCTSIGGTISSPQKFLGTP